MSINSSIPFGMFASYGKNPLAKLKNTAYSFYIAEKHSGQNSHSELFKKMHSRIVSGFFCACGFYRRHKRKLYYKMHCVMTGCTEEPKGSPFFFLSGNANSVQPVTYQFALKVTVSQFKKEAVLCA